MSKPISTNNKKYHQGMFQPTNPEKVVGRLDNINYKSSWEKKFMIWLDKNPDVIRWNSEGLIVKYHSTLDNKMHKYHVDFIFECKKADGTTQGFMVEIKPYASTLEPKAKRKTKSHLYECTEYVRNQCKWEAAREFAKKNNFIFKIITEYELGIKKR
jgi:hypothetical protein